jgi:DNA-binding MarR family transcriptional regulator
MPTYDDLADDIHRLWREIRRTAHSSRRGDLTPEQLWMLTLLRTNGQMSIGQLARTIGVTQGAVTTACQRLERAGLATRRRDSDDERVVWASITDLGSQRVEALQERQQAAVAPLLSTMSPQEATELRRLLRKMINATGDRPMVPALLWSVTNLAETII